ncbi:MAG: NAD-dependent epimerase/dehydratase family protein [Planctomycetota bacterium]
MKTQRIILTGAAGFIGSHTGEALLARGCDVLGLDNFDPFYNRALKEQNVAACHAAAERHGSRFEMREVDLADDAALRSQAEWFDADGIIHLAAKAGVRPSRLDPEGYARANVVGTTNVLELASQLGVHRVVAASSSSVYGDTSPVPFSESRPADEPISPYAATKRACELIGYTHHHLTGRPVAMLRFFTVYGPRQRPDLAINLFLRKIAAGEPIQMFGDGSTSRDYTYIDDIVAGVLAAYDRIDAHGYRVWNLGGSSPVRLDELIGAVGETVGREPQVVQKPIPPGDVRRTWADLDRSGAELGFEPGTALADGLARQWAWMRDRVTAPTGS